MDWRREGDQIVECTDLICLMATQVFIQNIPSDGEFLHIFLAQVTFPAILNKTKDKIIVNTSCLINVHITFTTWPL